jgi:hypothetical protein
LEGKVNAARPKELLDDDPKKLLDATTNLVGFPEGGKKGKYWDVNSLNFLLTQSF